jgi:hypothetical protein
MKITLRICLMLLAVFFSGAVSAEDGSRPKQPPYLFCNVYLSGGCFGIADGDKLAVHIITDYVRYDLQFSSGGTAVIYSGFNSSPIKQGRQFENCSWPSHFSECKMRTFEDGRIEYLSRRTNESSYIHLVIDKNVRPPVAESFLRNVTACVTSEKSIQCSSN